MTLSLSRRGFIAATAASFIVPARAAFPASHGATVVQMLNKDPDDDKRRNVFSPRLLVIEPGQSVKFEATDKGHNSASFKGMIPEGAEAWKGKINEEIELTFDVPGFYGYVCTPHLSLGMVGLIVVQGDGMLDNLEAARSARHRGKAKAAFEEIWEDAEAQGLLS